MDSISPGRRGDKAEGCPGPEEVRPETVEGEGGHGGRSLGLFLKEASLPMSSLVNGTPGVVPQLLGRSSLLCY